MQPVDLTTLVAVCHELTGSCLPARLEQVYQSDRHTLHLTLRTLDKQLWLLLSWHPQAARIHLTNSPPRQPDTFTFSQQIWHQVAGLALVEIKLVDPWERVVDLQFAQRPGDTVLWHVYVEIMGKYSNVVLVNSSGTIVTAAHQVGDKQSRVRPIQTGQQYELPPALLETIPTTAETFEQWQERLSLIPQQSLKRSLLTNYRGMSGALVRSLCIITELEGEAPISSLNFHNWQNLWQAWRLWLSALETKQFLPCLLDVGYTVIGDQELTDPCQALANSLTAYSSRSALAVQAPPSTKSVKTHGFATVNDLLRHYYTQHLYQQEFQQIYQQVNQVVQSHLIKQQHKAAEFQQRLTRSEQADLLKDQADLLMAHLHEWQAGMTEMSLPDFITSTLVRIKLDPQQNAVQNAQALYKQHQKQKRAKRAIMPLLAATNQEIHYLEQVATAATQLETTELEALQEIRLELIQQSYLKSSSYRPEDKKGNKSSKNNKSKKPDTLDCHRYKSPNGFEIWIGRNNYQNDTLTFRIANEYDIWFHTQEIPGSHVLLRLEPGAIPDQQDLQTAANLAAYYSRARQSEQVPVVFTKPKHVYKPNGTKPGMVVYKQEQVIWAQPHVSTPSTLP